jgi:hypothetical protein
MENHEAFEAEIVEALTDSRLRWKYLKLRDMSAAITSDVLNSYGEFGWEIASVSEVLETDQWGNKYYYTTVILKMPYYYTQEESNGQS